jgi:predicted nuclease of predicted toxin-antitoxin system
MWQRSFAAHDVHSVYEEQLAGEADPTIASACQRENRVLVTLDLDFADVRRYPPAELSGVIVLRPRQQSIAAQLELVEQLLRRLTVASPKGELWVVEPGRVRVRA